MAPNPLSSNSGDRPSTSDKTLIVAAAYNTSLATWPNPLSGNPRANVDERATSIAASSAAAAAATAATIM